MASDRVDTKRSPTITGSEELLEASNNDGIDEDNVELLCKAVRSGVSSHHRSS